MNSQTTGRGRPTIFDELNRGLNQIMQGMISTSVPETRQPAISILDLADCYVFDCDLPGIAPDEITLQVDDGDLMISAERRPAEFPSDATIIADERPAGTVRRRVRLPGDADCRSVDAEHGAGVLRVTIKKIAAAVPTKILIRAV